MAKWTADDVYITVNGTDLSDHVDSVDVSEEYALKEAPGMGANAIQKIVSRAKMSSITVEFINDYAASKVWATLKPLVGSNTAFTVIARPTSGTASATNPQATFMAVLPKWSPIAGQYGEIGKTPVTFECGDSTGIVWTP